MCSRRKRYGSRLLCFVGPKKLFPPSLNFVGINGTWHLQPFLAAKRGRMGATCVPLQILHLLRRTQTVWTLPSEEVNTHDIKSAAAQWITEWNENARLWQEQLIATQSHIENETSVMQKVMYKNKNQHQKTTFWHKFKEVLIHSPITSTQQPL